MCMFMVVHQYHSFDDEHYGSDRLMIVQKPIMNFKEG